MKKTKRELLVLAAATTVALLMGVTVQAKGDEKVLNFGCQMYTDGCVNSANDENSGWNAMRYGIAEALFKFDDNMEVIPWLAESYEVNDEHTEWTIKLKDGIKFSDGCDLTPTKVKEYFEASVIDENRIAAEVTLYADKICVDEEMVRLRTHISHMKEALCTGGSVGRKLDFLAQEMNREANTTLSKINDVTLADVAIDMKTEIEKIREQVQNIE